MTGALLICLLTAWLPRADGVADAADAYRAEQYAHAANLYAELAGAEPDPTRAAVLHTNAGTSAARADKLGEAVWQLRRARQLAPRDAIAATNLDRVRALLGEGESEAVRFTESLLALPLALTRDESSTLAAGLAGLALLLLAIMRVAGRGRRGLWLAGGLVVLALTWQGAARLAWEREEARAIVIGDVVSGHTEPDERSEVLFRLSAGTTVVAEEQRREWRLVESAAGARGWVPANEVRPLAR
jgi:hypothetical protein